jgi:hypothetical protein
MCVHRFSLFSIEVSHFRGLVSVYILSTGCGKSLGLYKTPPNEEEIQDGEAFLLILFFLCHVLF